MTTTEIDCPASAFQGCDIATCDRPCTARAGEINTRQRVAMRRYNTLYFVAMVGIFICIATSVLLVGVSIYKAGAENIIAYNIAHERV